MSSSAEPQARVSANDPTQPERPDLSIGEIVSKLGDDVSNLLTTQVEIAKLEIKEEATKAAKGAGMMAGGAFAALVAVFMLSAALAWAIAEALDPWAGFLIVGLVWSAIAAVLALVGKNKVADASAVPERTMAEIQADKSLARELP